MPVRELGHFTVNRFFGTGKTPLGWLHARGWAGSRSRLTRSARSHRREGPCGRARVVFQLSRDREPAERNVVSAVTGTLFTHCQNLLQIPSHFPFHEQAPPPWMFRSVFPGFPNDSPPPLSTETGGWLEIIHRHFGRCSHHSAAARVLD